MTRKTFEAVAEILGQVDMPDSVRSALVRRFSDLFESGNSRFERDRFERRVATHELQRLAGRFHEPPRRVHGS